MIIALDLGRHNSVAYVYDRATRTRTFRTDTTPAAPDRLLARHKSAPVMIGSCADAGCAHDSSSEPATR